MTSCAAPLSSTMTTLSMSPLITTLSLLATAKYWGGIFTFMVRLSEPSKGLCSVKTHLFTSPTRITPSFLMATLWRLTLVLPTSLGNTVQKCAESVPSLLYILTVSVPSTTTNLLLITAMLRGPENKMVNREDFNVRTSKQNNYNSWFWMFSAFRVSVKKLHRQLGRDSNPQPRAYLLTTYSAIHTSVYRTKLFITRRKN